jgi:hypothetical protein
MQSKQIRLSEVPGYVRDHYGINMTRGTAYHWANPKMGKNGRVLPTTSIDRPGMTPIRTVAVDDLDTFVRIIDWRVGSLCRKV